VANFHVPRARLHARTLELERAAQLLQTLTRAHPRSFEAHVELALVLGRLRQLTSARTAAARARALAPAHPSVVAAERALETAAQLATRPARDPTASAVREAQIDLLLGAPEQARRRLDPLLAGALGTPGLIVLRAQIDALDRRVDLAKTRVERARRAMPEAEPHWQALLAELATLH
jgi:predicted Zn-dependent protease